MPIRYPPLLMTAVPLVDVNAFAPFTDFIRENGGEVYRYSDPAGIPRGMMEQLNGRITKVQATRFLESIRLMEGIPDVGYRVGRNFGPDQMGPLGVAMRRSATLGEAVGIFSKHLGDWWGGTRAWIERTNDRAWLRVAATDRMTLQRDVANQNGIFILTHLVRMAAGDDWTPSKIRIPPTPGNEHEQHPITGEAIPTFDEEEIAVEFPVELLAAPLLQNGPQIENLPIETHPEDLVGSVSRLLEEQIRHGILPGIEAAAGFIGTSKRSLQRRLHEESTSYRGISERIRFKIARELLSKESRMPLMEVARCAGYANDSSLIRSFRRMAGMTPGEFVRRDQK